MKLQLLLATTALIAARAFENKAGWKLDADGKIEMKDGNPVWVTAKGEEQVMQGDTIARLNNEAKTHREDKEKAQAELAKYTVNGKPIDPEIAIKAVDTVSKLDAKKLIDAGEVDKVRDEIKGQYEAQLSERDKALAERDTELTSLKIGSIFDGSDFVRESIAVPQDMFRSTFEKHFRIEEGKPVAYDKAGNRLMSKKNIGVYAEPDEALELLVDAHPQKDTILKANTGAGSGSGGGGGNRGIGNRTMKRSDFENLNPAARAEAAASMGKGELTVVD